MAKRRGSSKRRQQQRGGLEAWADKPAAPPAPVPAPAPGQQAPVPGQAPATEQSTLSQVYDGAAEFGLMVAFIGAIFGGFIGLAMLIGGIYVLVHKPEPPKPCTDKKNCPPAPAPEGNNTMLGWVLIFVGLLIGGLSIANYYMAKYSKAYAAVTGVGDGIGMIDGALEGPGEMGEMGDIAP